MKSIFKYTLDLTAIQKVKIGGFKEILSVAEQRGEIVVYALVDENSSKEPDIEFLILGTGGNASMLDVAKFKFLGTVNLSAGRYMWHVFYRIPYRGLRGFSECPRS